MTIIEWAHSGKAENNWLTRVLCGDMDSPTLTVEHLALAKEIINRKFVVGLTTDMAGSWSRFRSHFGWVASKNQNSDACMKQMTEEGANTNKHRDINEDSEEWRAVASLNQMDMQLYRHIVELFKDERVREEVWSFENDIDQELENVVNAVQGRKLAEYPSTSEDRSRTIGPWYFKPTGPIRCSNDGKHPASYELYPEGHLFEFFEECCQEYWGFAVVECRRNSALEANPLLYYPTLISASTGQGITSSPANGGQTSSPAIGGQTSSPAIGGQTSSPAIGGQTSSPAAGGSNTPAPTTADPSSAPVVFPPTNRKLQQTVGSCIADGLQPNSITTGGLVYSSITECCNTSYDDSVTCAEVATQLESDCSEPSRFGRYGMYDLEYNLRSEVKYYPSFEDDQYCFSSGLGPGLLQRAPYADPSQWEFDTLLECCKQHYHFDLDACMNSDGDYTYPTGLTGACSLSGRTGEPKVWWSMKSFEQIRSTCLNSDKWYVQYYEVDSEIRCVKDCEGDDYPCDERPSSYMEIYDSFHEVCAECEPLVDGVS